jgi:hypothetical protein
MALRIEYLPVEKLRPYERNARTHSDAQIDAIAESIRQFGFNSPILIDDDNGVIAGHARLAAARKLGLDTVPCVRLSHLNDAQRRVYILADNRLAEMAVWDEELLSEFVGDWLLSPGKRFISTTSHPAMIAHRSRSPKWHLKRIGRVSPAGKSTTRKVYSANRLTASFEYVGCPESP